jgi:hypothetical protein
MIETIARRETAQPAKCRYNCPIQRFRFLPLKRDEIGMNRYRASGYRLSTIFSENRFTLFRIML